MKISDSLATLNKQRFKDFEDTTDASGSALSPGTTPSGGNVWRRACHAFTGPAFLGLDAHTLANEDLEWAQDKLHILCGLCVWPAPVLVTPPLQVSPHACAVAGTVSCGR